MKSNVTRLALLALAFLPYGCSSAGDEQPSPSEEAEPQSKLFSGPSGEVYPSEEQRNAALAGLSSENPQPSIEINKPPAALLATVRLSATHLVEFYELEPGVKFAVERFHVDRDLDGQPILFGPRAQEETRQRPLLDMYFELVGDKIDSKVADVLAAADRRGSSAGAAAQRNLPASVEQDLSSLYGVGDDLVDKTHAGCPAPSGWDWNSDSIWWFETNGCYNQFSCTQNCWRYNCIATDPAEFLEDPGNGRWREAQVYITSGFAQQFCNKAMFQMWRQEGSHYLVHYKVFEATLEPRHFISTNLGVDRTPLLRMQSWIKKISGNQPNKKAIAVRWWHPDFWD
jgi:hypothetical protein